MKVTLQKKGMRHGIYAQIGKKRAETIPQQFSCHFAVILLIRHPNKPPGHSIYTKRLANITHDFKWILTNSSLQPSYFHP